MSSLHCVVWMHSAWDQRAPERVTSCFLLCLYKAYILQVRQQHLPLHLPVGSPVENAPHLKVSAKECQGQPRPRPPTRAGVSESFPSAGCGLHHAHEPEGGRIPWAPLGVGPWAAAHFCPSLPAKLSGSRGEELCLLYSALYPSALH